MLFILALITAQKRSLGQGNVFTHVYLSFCLQGVCIPACNGQRSCIFAYNGAGIRCVSRGVCPWVQGVYTLPRHTPPGHPCRDDHWNGRYASYWNAFLFDVLVIYIETGFPKFMINNSLTYLIN